MDKSEARWHLLVAVQDDDDDYSVCDTGISVKIYKVCINFTSFPLVFYTIDNYINLCRDIVNCKINRKWVEHMAEGRVEEMRGEQRFLNLLSFKGANC